MRNGLAPLFQNLTHAGKQNNDWATLRWICSRCHCRYLSVHPSGSSRSAGGLDYSVCERRAFIASTTASISIGGRWAGCEFQSYHCTRVRDIEQSWAAAESTAKHWDSPADTFWHWPVISAN